MIFERIVSDSLMCWTYLVGGAQGLVVIDPRVDYEIYLERARHYGVPLRHVLETHRHEDMVSGACGLAEASGAEVWHSAHEDLGYQFGAPLEDGTRFVLDEGLELVALHTPGHTRGHLCYVLERLGKPYMVFTGDTLFYGGVGRTDFYGEDQLEAMTRQLHDSIYNRLAPLGDGVLVMPAHGAGSACGAGLDDRPWSTLGFEFAVNPALDADADAFVAKNGYMHYKNPAFETMEVVNVEGAGVATAEGPLAADLSAFEEAEARRRDEGRPQIIDLRENRAFYSGHLPGSVNIPAYATGTWAGWFFPTDSEILLVGDGACDDAIRLSWETLRRGGYSGRISLLGEDKLTGAAFSGMTLETLGTITPEDYLSEAMAKIPTLDVRQRDEFSEDDPIHGRISIPLQELAERYEELPEGPLFVLCGSGGRATIAASWLKAMGCEQRLRVIAGGNNGLRAARDRVDEDAE